MPYVSSMDIDAIIWGCFSEHDRDLATSGLCGTFALALKDALPDVELELVCLTDRDNNILKAEDSEPYWRHVVARHDGDLFDIEGMVFEEDVIANYCLGNSDGHGGALLPVTSADLRSLLTTDRSFDARHYQRWKDILVSELAAEASFQI